MKDEARKSNLRKAGNSLRKWTGNSLKRKSGKSLNAKAGHQERKSRDFMTRNGLRDRKLLKLERKLTLKEMKDFFGQFSPVRRKFQKDGNIPSEYPVQ